LVVALQALVDVFVITTIFIPYGLDLQLVAVERWGDCGDTVSPFYL
jgi:hypothetical protein